MSKHSALPSGRFHSSETDKGSIILSEIREEAKGTVGRALTLPGTGSVLQVMISKDEWFPATKTAHAIV